MAAVEPTRFPNAIVTEFADTDTKCKTLVAGFVGAGLVGPIAAGHIVAETGMDEFACMRSRHLPPAAVFIRGHLQHPFRFYSNKSTGMCAIICETTIQMDGVYDIISAIFDWIKSKNAQELVILDGIASDSHDDVAYYAAEKDLHSVEKSSGIQMISRGFLTGISGGLLDECLLHNVRGSAILVKAKKDGPDPAAAATLVEAINSLYRTDISTESLRSNTLQIGDKFSELSKRYTRHRDETHGMYM